MFTLFTIITLARPRRSSPPAAAAGRRCRRTVHAGAADLGLPIYPAVHSITGSVTDKDIEVFFVLF